MYLFSTGKNNGSFMFWIERNAERFWYTGIGKQQYCITGITVFNDAKWNFKTIFSDERYNTHTKGNSGEFIVFSILDLIF